MISIKTIVQTVADYYGVEPADIYSARRDRKATGARQVTIWLARKLTTYSLPRIGRHIGGRDHTTVLHSIHKIDERCRFDPDLGEQLTALHAILVGTEAAVEHLGFPEPEEFDPARVAARILAMPPSRRHASHDELALICASLLGAMGVQSDADEEGAPDIELEPTPGLIETVARALGAHRDFQSARYSAREKTATRQFEAAMTDLQTLFEKEFPHVGDTDDVRAASGA